MSQDKPFLSVRQKEGTKSLLRRARFKLRSEELAKFDKMVNASSPGEDKAILLDILQNFFNLELKL